MIVIVATRIITISFHSYIVGEHVELAKFLSSFYE